MIKVKLWCPKGCGKSVWNESFTTRKINYVCERCHRKFTKKQLERIN